MNPRRHDCSEIAPNPRRTTQSTLRTICYSIKLRNWYWPECQPPKFWQKTFRETIRLEESGRSKPTLPKQHFEDHQTPLKLKSIGKNKQRRRLANTKGTTSVSTPNLDLAIHGRTSPRHRRRRMGNGIGELTHESRALRNPRATSPRASKVSSAEAERKRRHISLGLNTSNWASAHKSPMTLEYITSCTTTKYTTNSHSP